MTGTGLTEALDADSIYFLMPVRSDASEDLWSFAVGWTRHLPAVMVTQAGRTCARGADGLYRVLTVPPDDEPPGGAAAQLRTAMIRADMRRHGAARPILWLIDADFAEAFAVLPAAARVLHMTGNVFQMPGVASGYLSRFAMAAGIADFTIAASSMCALYLPRPSQPQRLMIRSLGGDSARYAAGVAPDAETQSLRASFARLAIFAGPIDGRIDFALLARASERAPDTLMLFAGQVAGDTKVAEDFAALLRRDNVHHLGAVTAGRLPALYRAADFGFVPFCNAPAIVENTAPPVVFEMAATGLPVVTTPLKTLFSYSPPLAVAQDDDSFLAAFAGARRDSGMAAALQRLAAANDYDMRISDFASRIAAINCHVGAHLTALSQAWPHIDVQSFGELSTPHFYRLRLREAFRRRLFLPLLGQARRIWRVTRRLLGRFKRAMRPRPSASA